MKSFRLDRRAMLRGAGVAMSLPLLEAMLPVGKSVFAAGTAAPPRFLAYFTSCGILDNHFKMNDGKITKLSQTLSSFEYQSSAGSPNQKFVGFEGLENKISQIRGVASPAVGGEGGGGSAHADGCQSWLRAAGRGASVDQLAHKAHMAGPMAERTRFGSLAMGLWGECRAQDLQGGPSALCAISWADTGSYVVKDANPQKLFNKLFQGFTPIDNAEQAAKRKAMDESVLSSVKDHAKGLGQKMSAADRQVIDQYFTSIQALEQRLAGMDNQDPLACGKPTTVPIGISEDNPPTVEKAAIAKALSDLTVIAFQCDLFRYGSYMIENGGDYSVYSNLGATGVHHEMSHIGDTPTLARIENWMYSELAYLAHGLNNAKDITGASLLDSCTIMSGSEVGNGKSHSHDNMPFLMVGSCNGRFKMGQTIPSGGNYGDVWVEVMNALGYPTTKIGNSTGRKPTEILA